MIDDILNSVYMRVRVYNSTNAHRHTNGSNFLLRAKVMENMKRKNGEKNAKKNFDMQLIVCERVHSVL